MKKTLAVIALSTLLATPVLADSQPADTEGGLAMKMKGVSLNFGGFIAAEALYRSRNQNTDLASAFQSLPTPNQTNFYQDETRFSARQSRLSVLASGNATPTIHLAGYYEMDFLGAANTANSKETNSYNPRIRHLYTTADWDSLGLHLLAGQTWSLVTMNNKGITPRNEVTPVGIEAQYVPGFTWARQPQFRITKDFDKKLWLAVSVENPQTVAVSNPATNTSLGQAGAVLLNGVTVSQNDVPDVVFKAAVEPGWGHFEVFDLLRTFSSTLNTIHTYNTTTNAVGGGVVLPLVPKQLTLTVSGTYGRGIGRYGAGQLADVTTDSIGAIVPITEAQLLAGLVYDPTSDWTFYGYYGLEQAQRLTLGGGTGYGNPALVTAFGAPGSATFKGQVQRIDQGTLGLWWKFLQGSYGKMQAGLQYSYTENKFFSGTAGAPKTSDNMAFTSVRYYWQ
jgi:hypothetical protein